MRATTVIGKINEPTLQCRTLGGKVTKEGCTARKLLFGERCGRCPGPEEFHEFLCRECHTGLPQGIPAERRARMVDALLRDEGVHRIIGMEYMGKR